MKVCVDENVLLVSVQELRILNHDVLDIRGTNEQGLPDELLWEKAQRENRLLITPAPAERAENSSKNCAGDKLIFRKRVARTSRCGARRSAKRLAKYLTSMSNTPKIAERVFD